MEKKIYRILHEPDVILLARSLSSIGPYSAVHGFESC
jgi:hypothetical protein